jgi:hypothetical protein
MSEQRASDTDVRILKAIDLLMEEYKSLRGETTQRFLSPPLFALTLGAVAALTTAAVKGAGPPWLYAVGGGLLIWALLIWREGNRWALYDAAQLCEIEIRVNELAKQAKVPAGPFLTWETRMAAQREGMRPAKKCWRRLCGLYIAPGAMVNHRAQRNQGAEGLRPAIPHTLRASFDDVFAAGQPVFPKGE